MICLDTDVICVAGWTNPGRKATKRPRSRECRLRMQKGRRCGLVRDLRVDGEWGIAGASERRCVRGGDDMVDGDHVWRLVGGLLLCR